MSSPRGGWPPQKPSGVHPCSDWSSPSAIEMFETYFQISPHRKHSHLVDARLALEVQVSVLLGSDAHVGDHLGDRVVVLVDHVNVLLLTESLVLRTLPGHHPLKVVASAVLEHRAVCSPPQELVVRVVQVPDRGLPLHPDTHPPLLIVRVRVDFNLSSRFSFLPRFWLNNLLVLVGAHLKPNNYFFLNPDGTDGWDGLTVILACGANNCGDLLLNSDGMG